MAYSKDCYAKGNPKLNLALNERKLLLRALLKANWNVVEALRLNFPKENVSRDSYSKMLAKHRISIRNKSYKKLIEIK
jgi:hypothetical protein